MKEILGLIALFVLVAVLVIGLGHVDVSWTNNVLHFLQQQLANAGVWFGGIFAAMHLPGEWWMWAIVIICVIALVLVILA